jgi:hypothetical protein
MGLHYTVEKSSQISHPLERVDMSGMRIPFCIFFIPVLYTLSTCSLQFPLTPSPPTLLFCSPSKSRDLINYSTSTKGQR